MTKYFFILAMFLGMTLQAQNLRFNSKVGAGFYDFNVSKGTDVDPKIMVTLGCDVRIGSGNLFFNTGLHYSADAFNKDANTFSEKGSINFLRVPVGVGYYITGRDGILSLHLKGGLVNNFNISNSGLGKDFDSLVKKYNLAGNLGLGAEVLKFIHIGVEYDLGLTNYFDTDDILVAKKGAFLISLGVTF